MIEMSSISKVYDPDSTVADGRHVRRGFRGIRGDLSRFGKSTRKFITVISGAKLLTVGSAAVVLPRYTVYFYHLDLLYRRCSVRS